MKTPTLAEFKRWTRDVAPAARAVLMARAYAEIERERVNAYIAPIFAAYKFRYAERWRGSLRRGAEEFIEKPDDLYLAEDGPEIAWYFEECDRAHRAHGFTGPHGHCPALRAENMVATVEGELLKLAEDLLGLDPNLVWGDDRKRYLELLIGACLKAESEAA